MRHRTNNVEVFMPELPEVEVVRRGLQSALSTKSPIKYIQFLRPNLRYLIPQRQIKTLIGVPFLSIERRAKFLLFKAAKGTLISHLGMTGIWRIDDGEGDLQKHDHVIIQFHSGERWIYNDPRRFGFVDFCQGDSSKTRHFSQLGREPLAPDFDAEYLSAMLKGKKSSIKAAIMDQKIVVGVGNIYAAEALFQAGIRPQLLAHRIRPHRLEELCRAIKEILQTAIVAGGSSISDFRQTTGAQGYFQNQHRVYGRAGCPCLICATPIKSKVIAGRSSFYCPTCQK